MESIFFHIDVNSAFLSWSALKRLEEGEETDLRLIPSVVGGDQETRHGIVTAKSIPAKAYGIQTAEPVASAMRKCPGLVVIPPDFPYYRQKSRQLMDYLTSICSEIEQVSIDECYMSYEPIRGVYGSPERTAAYLKDNVRERFGFTVNVGISDRKVLAKVASDFKKPDLVHTLYHTEIREKLWPMPVGDLHMCGKSSAAALIRVGIRTVGDLAQADPGLIESLLKSHGRMLQDFANGIDDSVVVTERGKAKGVGNSTTLAKDVESAAEAKQVLHNLCESVSARLKKQSFLAGCVTVEIKYATFQSVSHQSILLTPTSETEILAKQAYVLFDELWDKSPIRLLGVRTTKLEDEGDPVQLNLFDYQSQVQDEVKREKQQQLDRAMSAIRAKYGEDALKKGI